MSSQLENLKSLLQNNSLSFDPFVESINNFFDTEGTLEEELDIDEVSSLFKKSLSSRSDIPIGQLMQFGYRYIHFINDDGTIKQVPSDGDGCPILPLTLVKKYPELSKYQNTGRYRFNYDDGIHEFSEEETYDNMDFDLHQKDDFSKEELLFFDKDLFLSSYGGEIHKSFLDK